MHVGPTVETVFYVLSTVALMAGAVGFARRKYREALQRQQAEAAEKGQLSRALESNASASTANAEANQRNTEALGKLGSQLGSFVNEVRDVLTRHSHTLDAYGQQLTSHQRGIDNHDWRLGLLERDVERFHGTSVGHHAGEEPPAIGPVMAPDPEVRT